MIGIRGGRKGLPFRFSSSWQNDDWGFPSWPGISQQKPVRTVEGLRLAPLFPLC